jgi:hypothetical protein
MPSWEAVGAGLKTDCEKEWGSSDVKRVLIASHTSVASSRITQIASGQNQAPEEKRGEEEERGQTQRREWRGRQASRRRDMQCGIRYGCAVIDAQTHV